MDARTTISIKKNTEMLKIKKQVWEADQVSLTAPINSNSNQLRLDAKTNRHTKSNDKAC